MVNEDFPGRQIDDVVEYDPLPGHGISKLRKMCERHGISYVKLQSVIPESVDKSVKIGEGSVIGKLTWYL